MLMQIILKKLFLIFLTYQILSMNNKQQLKEQSLLYLLSQNNFIVPEIQREYVWGQNEEVISRFIDSIIEKIGIVCDQCGNPKKKKYAKDQPL